MIDFLPKKENQSKSEHNLASTNPKSERSINENILYGEPMDLNGNGSTF